MTRFLKGQQFRDSFQHDLSFDVQINFQYMKIVFYVSQIGWCFCKMGFKIIDINMDVNSMGDPRLDSLMKWVPGDISPLKVELFHPNLYLVVGPTLKKSIDCFFLRDPMESTFEAPIRIWWVFWRKLKVQGIFGVVLLMEEIRPTSGGW